MKWRTRNGRKQMQEKWQPWFAWRPVRIPQTEAGKIVIPEHRVWLEHVDRKRYFGEGILWDHWKWMYRTHVPKTSQ